MSEVLALKTGGPEFEPLDLGKKLNIMVCDYSGTT